MSDYHSAPIEVLTASRLKRFATLPSPAHYLHDFGLVKDSAALTIGRLVHSMILEPYSVAAEYIRAEPLDRRTKEGKAAFAEIQTRAESTGATVVQEADWQAAQAAADRVRLEHPWVDSCGVEGIIEHVYETACPETALPIKCKPDIVLPESDEIWDLKTVSSLARFESQFWNLRYDLQSTFYQYVIALAAGWNFPPVKFMVVETQPPYETAIYTLPNVFDEQSTPDMIGHMRRYAECVKAGTWPGIGTREIRVPGWMQARLDGALEAELQDLEEINPNDI